MRVPDQSKVAPSSALVGMGCDFVLPIDGLKSTNSVRTGVLGSVRPSVEEPDKIGCDIVLDDDLRLCVGIG